MPVSLRAYQLDLIERLRAALSRVKSVLVQAPTGAGKTILASFMIEGTTARGQSAWFICHRAELVEGTSKTLSKFGLAHGFIAGGMPMNLRQLVQVCSIDTLKNRLDGLQAPKIAIIDEAHHTSAAGWALVVQWLRERGTIVIGLSATPKRLDGKGLDEHFNALVLGPAVAWLMEHGHLAHYKIFAPPPPPELKARGKDDGRRAQAKVLDRPKLTGDVVGHWLEHAQGMRTVGFACNVQHSLNMVEAFNKRGIPAAHLDGNTKRGERKRIIQDFAAGRILVLWNVQLFGEGFDLAAIAGQDVTIDCVILNRKTDSVSLFLQMVGRALRPNADVVKIILDHAGNTQQHGFPDDERTWSLQGKEAGAAANDNGPPPPITCDKCWNQIKRPAPPACPHCKKLLVPEVKAPEVVAGKLEEQTEAHKKATRARLMQEQADAKTLDDLIALARKRGHKHPLKWAQHVFFNRRRAA